MINKNLQVLVSLSNSLTMSFTTRLNEVEPSSNSCGCAGLLFLGDLCSSLLRPDLSTERHGKIWGHADVTWPEALCGHTDL